MEKMERNWYITCTRQNQELNVSAILNKKGIENYCPLTINKKKNGNGKTIATQPLFTSFVFVYATEAEIKTIKNISSVVNLAYYKNRPAIISKEEVSAIKIMADSYSSISLEKTSISMDAQLDVVEESITSIENNTLRIRPTGLSMTLPSIGYKMTAKRADAKENATTTKVVKSKSILSRLNPLAFFSF